LELTQELTAKMDSSLFQPQTCKVMTNVSAQSKLVITEIVKATIPFGSMKRQSLQKTLTTPTM